MEEKCVPLTMLDLDSIKFDQEIYDRCGQLVFHLVDDRTGDEVSAYNRIGVT